MDTGLKNKLALITGSTKGIGFAAAKLLHAEGARVIINGRSKPETEAAARKIGERAYGIAGDVSTLTGVEALAAEVRKIGEPEILINNAGIFDPKDFFEIPDAEWTRFFEINVMSGVRLSKIFMPAMLKKNWGRVIFISSESGISTPVEMIHYGMTKTAQLAVSRGLAELTKGTNVTVNSVLPGPTMSDGVKTFVKDLGAKTGKSAAEFEKDIFFKEARPTSLIQRFATTEEVANLIVYTASALSSATNGTALRVDGGTVKSII